MRFCIQFQGDSFYFMFVTKKSGFLMVSVHQLTFRIGNNNQTIGIESIALPAKRRALMGSSGTKTSLLGGFEPFGNLNHLGHIFLMEMTMEMAKKTSRKTTRSTFNALTAAMNSYPPPNNSEKQQGEEAQSYN